MRLFEVKKRKVIGSPISLEQAKNQMNLELTFTEDDSLIQGFIDTSEQRCSGIIKGSIFKTEVTHSIKNYFSGKLIVKESPLISIISVSVYDKDDNEILLTEDDYLVEEDQYEFYIEILPEKLLQNTKVVLKYLTGYEDSEVPSIMIQAILINTTTLYDNERSDYIDYRSKANRSIYNLLSPHIIQY